MTFMNQLAEKIYSTISEKLNGKGNICEVIETYAKYMHKEKKIIQKQNDSDFHGFCKINEKEREKYVKNQLSKLPIDTKQKKLH